MSKEFFNIQARNSFNKIGKYTSTHKGLSIQSATRAQVIYVREHILFCMTTDGSMSTTVQSIKNRNKTAGINDDCMQHNLGQ